MAAKIQTEKLSAWYGPKKAIEDITLDFEEHAVSAIIGPSGCGKSTLIRCLNRMHETIPKARAEGKVLLNNEDIYALPAVTVRRRIGMVFQKANPFPTMTIYENVAAGLRLNGERDRDKLDAAVLESLKAAALWDEVKDSLDKSGASLSGGQQQRLCIARALAVKPEVLLMDEPCSALDPIATAKIEDLIFDLKKDYTLVIVTHNMQQAARVAETTAFMYLGKLIEVGRTRELFERIGRYGKDLAELTLQFRDKAVVERGDVARIREMADRTISMVDTAIDAFVRRNAETVRNMIEVDDAVDQLHDENFRDLVRRMSEGQLSIETGARYLLVNRYFERIADHAVNIGLRVVYMVTGDWLPRIRAADRAKRHDGTKEKGAT